VRIDHERLACTLVHAIDTDGAHVLIALQVANPDSVSHARRVAESVREGALRVACASNQTYSDALRRTQTHSGVLRRTQTHSDALRRTRTHSDALRRTQTHSDAIKDNQKPSELIRAHQGSSESLIAASCT
jgi:hypothetical protein